MGHSVSTYAYPDDLSAEWFDYLWIFDIVDLVEQRTDQLGRKPEEAELEPLTWHLLEKARSAGRHAYDEAQEAKAFYTSRYLASMQHIDILLTPTLAEDPPETGALSFKAFGDVERWNSAGYGFAPFSTPSNLSGQPSASCPWLKNASGLSIGVQISGKPGADILVLQLAAQLERAHQELA
jgi:amidase